MRIAAAVSRDGTSAPVIEELELGPPRAGEIRVRIVAAGICHTDIRAHDGGVLPTPRPVVLGHEGAGVVEELGPGVSHLAVGDAVVMSGASCGLCPSCQDSLPSYCHQMMPRAFGASRMDRTTALTKGEERIGSHFFAQSSFASHCIADARGAVKLPPDMPLDIAAPMGCGVITGAGAVFHSFGLKSGQALAVFGCGGVGLSAVMAAKVAGASVIAVVDPLAHRRELALELGATHVFDPAQDDLAAALRAVTPAGFHYSLNTTPAPEVFDAALSVLAMRGTCGFVTAPRGPWSPAMFPMLAGGRSLKGILGGDAAPQTTIPMLVDLWRQGRFPVDKMVTRYPFERIADAFQDVRAGHSIKPVLIMPQC